MPKHVNTFIKGIDKDSNVTKYSNERYYDAKNMRIVVDSTLSSLALTNIKGVQWTFYFTHSETGARELIVGNSIMKDEIIIFTKSSNNTTGNIYLIPSSIIDNSLSTLYLENLSTYKLISKEFVFGDDLEIVARYENTNIKKIWWVDNINNIRTCNLAEGNAAYWTTKNLDYFELYSNINFQNINFGGFTGGNLKSGMYQYAYSLYSNDKVETAYSPLSQLIPVGPSSINGVTSKSFKGGFLEEETGKGIIVTINNLSSSNYTRVRVVRLFYTTQTSIPEIHIVYEAGISSTILVNDTGKSLGTITIEDYNLLPHIFKAKTLETKNNFLFPGNITENTFNVDFDCRAFRFKSDGVGKVFSAEDGSGELNVVLAQPNANIPLTHNALNLFNILSNDGDSTKEYKYKANGPTLGGEGINVEYEFITQSMPYDNNWAGLTTHTIASGGVLPGYISPKGYTLVGYQRDEIYRFGAIFYDNKGRQSFVNWIGDIRFPSLYDGDYTSPYLVISDTGTWEAGNEIWFFLDNKITVYEFGPWKIPLGGTWLDIRDAIYKWLDDLDPVPPGLTWEIVGDTIVITGDVTILPNLPNYLNFEYFPSTGGDYDLFTKVDINNYKSNILGIRFKFKNLPSNIIGYQIVRLERNYSEGTVIDTGYLNPLFTNTVENRIEFQEDLTASSTGNRLLNLLEYITPTTNYKVDGVSKGDRLDIFKSYKRELLTKGFDNFGTLGVDAAIYDIVKTVKLVGGGLNEIDRVAIDNDFLWKSERESPKNITVPGDISLLPLHNSIYTKFTPVGLALNACSGVKGTSLILKTDVNITAKTSSPYAIRRRMFYPYGGYTLADRVNSVYISCSPFLPSSTLGNWVEVWGGDTFITCFENMRILARTDNKERYLQVLFAGVESRINLNYTTNLRWSSFENEIIESEGDKMFKSPYFYNAMWETKGAHLVKTGTTDVFAQDFDLYTYNSVYSVLPTARKFFPKPLDFRENDKYPFRILRSDKKITNENGDSWSLFRFNNFLDLDSSYGELNKLILHNNTLFGLQDKAVNILPIEERETVTTNTNVATSIGTGGVLDRFDIISNKTGTKHLKSVCSSMYGLYYVDTINSKICRVREGIEYISDDLGIMSSISPLKIINAYTLYHPKYKEVWFNIESYDGMLRSKLENFTFSEVINGFSASNDTTANFSIKTDNNIFFLDRQNVYKMEGGEDYRTYKYVNGLRQNSENSVTLIINPNSVLSNRYDVLEFTCDTTDLLPPIYSVKFDNSYQNPTTVLISNSNLIRRFRTYRFNQLRDTDVRKSRIIDTYLKLKVNLNNAALQSIKLYDILTTYIPINLPANFR